MADGNLDAERNQTLGVRGFAQIGAGYLELQIVQNFGDAAHAGATDAYKMNALNTITHRRRLRKVVGETNTPCR